jgi:ABC-2 type transport system permease protein
MDMSRTQESRALRARFEGSGRFDIVAQPESEQEVQRLLDRSEVHAVVAVLPDFARDLARGRAAQVQVLLDGTNSNTASIVSAYAAGVIADFSADVALNPSKHQEMIQTTMRTTNAPGEVGA